MYHDVDDDDDDDNDDDDYHFRTKNQPYGQAKSSKIIHLTPKIYRLRQSTSPTSSPPLPSSSFNNFLQTTTTDDDIILNSKHLPQLISSNHHKKKLNYQFKPIPIDNNNQKSRKAFSKSHPTLMGDFMLKKKPREDRRFYNYKPKNTQVSYVYKGTLSSSEVQARALQGIKELSEQRHRSSSSNDFVCDIFKQNSPTYSTPHSPFIGNFHDKPRFNSCNQPIKPMDRYSFGPGSGSFTANDEEDYPNDGIMCVAFGRDTQPKQSYFPAVIQQPIYPKLNPSIFMPPMNDVIENLNLISLHQVADVGTSIDSTLLVQKPLKTTTNNPKSTPIERPLDNRESVFTNQSSRSESETYRVRQQMIDGDDDEYDGSQYPGIARTNASTVHSYENVKKQNNYELDDNNPNQSLDDQNLEEEEIVEEERSDQLSISNSSVIRNPMNFLQTPEYENLTNTRDTDSNTSRKLDKKHKSRPNFFSRLFGSYNDKSKREKKKKKHTKKKR